MLTLIANVLFVSEALFKVEFEELFKSFNHTYDSL